MAHRFACLAWMAVAVGCSGDGGPPPVDARIDAPIDDAPIDAPEIDAPIDGPAIDAPVDGPLIDAPIDGPVIDAPVDGPLVDGPAIDAPVDAPVIDAPIDAPPIDAPIDAPPIDAPIDAPPIDAPIDAPPIDAPIDAPLIDAPQNPWTVRTSNTIEPLVDVAWDGTRYIALGGQGGALESTDGITWSASTTSGFEPFLGGFAIAHAGPLDRWIVVGDVSSDGRIYTRDGTSTTWVLRASYPERTRAVLWAGPPLSRFVVGTAAGIRTSADGVTWSAAVAGSAGADIFELTWPGPGSNLVAVGRNGVVLTSTDATTWTAQTPPTGTILNDVAGHDAVFVAITNDTPSIFRSTNGGVVFADTGSVFTAGAVAWTGTRFDAFFTNNALPLESVDGLTWISGSSISGQSVSSIIAEGPRIVAVGSGGLIATREH